MDKRPRFFCDNCNREVERNAKSCPHCGRFFASVRCPSCGFIGEEKAFLGGCPSCGYSAPQTKSAPPVTARHFIPAGKLPLWVYIISICAFIGVCAVLILKIMS